MEAQQASNLNAADAPRWYAVQCKPGQNDRAQQNLENQGFVCFHPKLSIEKVKAGRRTTVLEPLFPGYLFIQIQPGVEDWSTLRSTRGVLRVVRFGTWPIAVPDTVIDALKLRDAGNQSQTESAYRAGQSVKITEGPFASLEAVFECFRGEERAVVLLSMLEKQHRIMLKVTDFTPA